MAAQTKEYTVQDEDKTYSLFMTPQDLSDLTTKYIKLEDKDNIDLSKVNDCQITVHRNKNIFIIMTVIGKNKSKACILLERTD